MNERSCIVTRRTADAGELIRFVAGPDGTVVPDLKRSLPGRGCWVSAERGIVDLAVRRNLFRRALRDDVRAPADLGELVDRLLARSALGALGLARKAGDVALGAVKVITAVRSGKAIGVLHATEAAPDGIRKVEQARKAVRLAGGPDIPAYRLFSEAEMSLAMGAANVIHAAVLAGPAGNAALKRIIALDSYRNSGANARCEAADSDGAAS